MPLAETIVVDGVYRAVLKSMPILLEATNVPIPLLRFSYKWHIKWRGVGHWPELWDKLPDIEAMKPADDPAQRGDRLVVQKQVYTVADKFYHTLHTNVLKELRELKGNGAGEILRNWGGIMVFAIYQAIQRVSYALNISNPVFKKLSDVPGVGKFTETDRFYRLGELMCWESHTMQKTLCQKAGFEYRENCTYLPVGHWPLQENYIEYDEDRTYAIKIQILGHTWTRTTSSHEEWLYAHLLIYHYYFYSNTMLEHTILGHFPFYGIMCLTLRHLSQNHPLAMFINASIHGAWSVMSQTQKVATDSPFSVIHSIVLDEGSHSFTDYEKSWALFDFANEDYTLRYEHGDDRSRYIRKLSDITRSVCEEIVHALYPTQDAITLDVELLYWFEEAINHIPGMYRTLTPENLSKILYKFHMAIVSHDFFHDNVQKNFIAEMAGSSGNPKHGDALSVLPSKVTFYAAHDFLAKFGIQTGYPYGHFWKECFPRNPDLKAILDRSCSKLNMLHNEYEDVAFVRHTILA